MGDVASPATGSDGPQPMLPPAGALADPLSRDRPWEPYRALYLHIPFCRSRCSYCDFATEAVEAGSSAVDAYFERLVMDVRRASKAGALGDIETIYVGGGTPTHAGNSNLTQLLYALSLSVRLENVSELTVEANPESFGERMAKDLWALGANRISLGVQSFDDGLLRRIGRPHSADDALRAIEMAHSRFENVSIDLMCGLPGQDVADVEESIGRALAEGVTHVSLYPLALEEGTPLALQVQRGEAVLPSDDDAAEMMVQGSRLLESSGLARYEVANHAKEGFESRHNLAYWTGIPYLGIGTSAATMRQDEDGRVRIVDGRVTDSLDRRERVAEDMMLAMRTTRGIPDPMAAAASRELPRTEEVLSRLVGLGLAERSDGRWSPTERGWLLGNEMYVELMGLSDPTDGHGPER